MSGIDEIIGYQKNSDEDFYGMLNCNESSTVSSLVVIVKYSVLQKKSVMQFEKEISLLNFDLFYWRHQTKVSFDCVL